MTVFYKAITINNKEIYMVENHHEVLQVWAEYRSKKNKAPLLFSLDHHTDTHLAFLHYSYDPINYTCRDDIASKLVDSIDFTNNTTVVNAIKKLKNDEHIDTAIKAKIIENAFLVTYMESNDNPLSFEEQEYTSKWLEYLIRQKKLDKPKRPFHYPKSDIYVIGNLCAVGCERQPHNDDCLIPHYNQAIESVFLEDKLIIMNEMLPGIINNNQIISDYILDIDLDYFHTKTSVKPKEPQLFYDLIRNSSIITIATEPWYVNEWNRIQDKDISSEFLLDEVLKHIHKATN